MMDIYVWYFVFKSTFMVTCAKFVIDGWGQSCTQHILKGRNIHQNKIVWPHYNNFICKGQGCWGPRDTGSGRLPLAEIDLDARPIRNSNHTLYFWLQPAWRCWRWLSSLQGRAPAQPPSGGRAVSASLASQSRPSPPAGPGASHRAAAARRRAACICPVEWGGLWLTSNCVPY